MNIQIFGTTKCFDTKIHGRSAIFIRNDFYILNIIINKIGSKKTYLEIDSSIDAFPGMTRYQPVIP